MEVYRAIETKAPDYQPREYYSSDADAAEWLASISGDYIPRQPARGDVTPAAEGATEAVVVEGAFGEESIG